MSDIAPQVGNQGAGSPLIINWLDAFHGRTRLEKQEAIAECYSEKIRTAGCCLNLIGLHELWPRDGEDAWENFVGILRRQADEEDAAVALRYDIRPRKKPAEASKPVPPLYVALEAPRPPVDPYDALMASFAKHGVAA